MNNIVKNEDVLKKTTQDKINDKKHQIDLIEREIEQLIRVKIIEDKNNKELMRENIKKELGLLIDKNIDKYIDVELLKEISAITFKIAETKKGILNDYNIAELYLEAEKLGFSRSETNNIYFEKRNKFIENVLKNDLIDFQPIKLKMDILHQLTQLTILDPSFSRQFLDYLNKRFNNFIKMEKAIIYYNNYISNNENDN